MNSTVYVNFWNLGRLAALAAAYCLVTSDYFFSWEIVFDAIFA